MMNRSPNWRRERVKSRHKKWQTYGRICYNISQQWPRRKFQKSCQQSPVKSNCVLVNCMWSVPIMIIVKCNERRRQHPLPFPRPKSCRDPRRIRRNGAMPPVIAIVPAAPAPTQTRTVRVARVAPIAAAVPVAAAPAMMTLTMNPTALQLPRKRRRKQLNYKSLTTLRRM